MIVDPIGAENFCLRRDYVLRSGDCTERYIGPHSRACDERSFSFVELRTKVVQTRKLTSGAPEVLQINRCRLEAFSSTGWLDRCPGLSMYIVHRVVTTDGFPG